MLNRAFPQLLGGKPPKSSLISEEDLTGCFLAISEEFLGVALREGPEVNEE